MRNDISDLLDFVSKGDLWLDGLQDVLAEHLMPALEEFDLSPKFPPVLRGVLGVKSLAFGHHLVHRLSLQKFHYGHSATKRFW